MKTTVFFLLLITNTTNVNAQMNIYEHYHPTVGGENLVVQFNHLVEATTVGQYNGYLALHFTGFGYNNPNEAFDAFYYFINAGQTSWEPQRQGLGIAFDGNLTINGGRTLYETEIGNTYADNLWQIVFNNTIGPYSGPNRQGFPGYNSGHIYDIVLLINSQTPRTLNFGFLDGGLGDNSGYVNITLTPVDIGAVPEPTVLALCIFVGAPLLLLRRNK